MATQAILDRYQVIVLKQAGWQKADVIRHIGRSKHFVNTWWNRPNPEDAPRAGRPPRYTRALVKSIAFKLWRRGGSLATRAVQLQTGYPLSSIRRIARGVGLKSTAVHHHPYLNPTMIAERLAFAKAHLHDDFSNTLWEDEKKVHLNPTPNKKNDRVWVYDGEEPEGRPTFAHSAKLNVAAAVMSGGRSEIHIFAENMDKHLYKKILEQTLLPAGKRLGARG